MCLILFSYKHHPDYRLILAANRDEFYERDTRDLNFWREKPHILAGRDLKANGTWLGISVKGRLAAITNYRDPAAIKENAKSRGLIVSNFLDSEKSSEGWIEDIKRKANLYSGFNLLAGDRGGLFWYSNTNNKKKHIKPGIHGISNKWLDTGWPKVQKGKDRLKKLLKKDRKPDPEAIFSILSDRSEPDDNDLPDTGVGIEMERFLSPIFIVGDTYGTRSSSIILWDKKDKIKFIERSFAIKQGQITIDKTIDFEIKINR